ncbi:MAG: GNAT family N-acetyltransferase [Sphingorhabdus sp.]
MATRAINIGDSPNSPTGRLDSWLVQVDDAFVSAWDDLAACCVEPNIFAESWFLGTALAQFDPKGRVQLFTLWDEGCLVGLMPIAPQPQYGRWPVPHVQNWLHHNAFLGTPLVRSGFEHCFWRVLLALLDDSPGQALFAHFNGLTVDGIVATALSQTCISQNRRSGLVHQHQRALLTGDMTADAYLESAVRAKKRKELRRQRSRLAEEGSLSFMRHTDESGLAGWTMEFLKLERAGWKGLNGSALDCASDTRMLFNKALIGASQRGKLERLDLRLDGKPLAMLVNFISGPGCFSFKTAFDEDFARFSPGVLLQIENLALLDRGEVSWCDSCAAEGHPMIDSLWTGRRAIGRYSVAVGGHGRRGIFAALLKAELARNPLHKPDVQTQMAETGGVE